MEKINTQNLRNRPPPPEKHIRDEMSSCFTSSGTFLFTSGILKVSVKNVEFWTTFDLEELTSYMYENGMA